MRRIPWKPIAFVAIVGSLAVAGFFVDVAGPVRDGLEWIRGLGSAGPIVFIAAYIAATVLFVPGLILTMAAGTIFGVAAGTAYVSAASTAGAALAFLIGRYLARDAIAGRIAARPRFRAIDDAVAREGWRIVVLTRLTPVLPFNLLNYAYGLTRVRFREYVLASWIGMLPGTLLYVWIGSALESFAGLFDKERARSPLETAFFIGGLVVTAIVTVYVTRVASRALGRKTGPQGDEHVAIDR